LTRCEPAPSGLAVKLVRSNPCLEDESPLLDLAQRLVSWHTSPTTWTGGRSAWFALDRSAAPERDRIGALQGLKIKGLGSSGEADDTPAHPPSTEVYVRGPGYRDAPHLGFDARGEFCLVDSPPAPRGGMLLDAAEREFDIASHLLAQGVQTVAPIAVFSYPDCTFEGRQMGAVVTGVPFSEFRAGAGTRLSALDGSAQADYVRTLAAAYAVDLDRQPWGTARLELFAHVSEAIGRSLRCFSEAGCYRYSSHPANFGLDGATRTAFPVDLDSSRLVAELPPDQVALLLCRDAMSGVFHVATEIVRPAYASASTSEQVALAPNPMLGFLRGYFSDTDVEPELCEGVWRYAQETRDRIERFLPAIGELGPVSHELFRHVRLQEDLVFSAIFRIVFSLYEHSGLARRWPPPIGVRELDARIRRFVGTARLGVVEAMLS